MTVHYKSTVGTKGLANDVTINVSETARIRSISQTSSTSERWRDAHRTDQTVRPEYINSKIEKTIYSQKADTFDITSYIPGQTCNSPCSLARGSGIGRGLATRNRHSSEI